MNNSDLIAFLTPLVSQFSVAGAFDLIDLTGRITDTQATARRLTMRFHVPAGMYFGQLETARGAFDMSTAMIEMVRVPDGKRVPVGPWDLDHIHNVMAMPMARTWVNGKLKGGLWFSVPGPEGIAEGRLSAEFGFEAQEGDNEVVLELVDRDRERMSWTSLAHLALRRDDRRRLPLLPAASAHPSVFLRSNEVGRIRTRWEDNPEFLKIREQLRTEDLVLLTDNSQGTLELACLVFALTGDAVVGARAKDRILDLAHAPTWSGRPDPLLMGGDNDRGISLRLFHLALGWDYLQPLLEGADRQALLTKADEYIGKMYDFTLLQRGYMGCPAIDPHSLGAWNGTAIACMAFYGDLPIARHALPFFHGLFTESLQLFPASGKAAWATYFPFHLILYLAAAHTFAEKCPELEVSFFLDHLGEALLTSFEAPNSQELQRGLRTREHRFLTAFLCRFHPTPGIEEIYRAFLRQERSVAGEVTLGIFDLLYAPAIDGPIAEFPDRPLYARDVGDLIATVRADHTLAVSLSGGPKAGRKAVFHLMPQNREFAPSMGAFEIAVDGAPVLCNINMGVYGINSALTNTMCFEDGGGITNGQYLNGAVQPEASAVIRRCFIGDRFLYAHIVITGALHPRLEVTHADRVFLLDRKTGAIVVSDAFAGHQPLRFATHLHCSGSVTDLAKGLYRLTGGQANLIAGIKGGGKGLDDAERGEMFVLVLRSSQPARVVIEEPTWIPGYIYGLNTTGKEDLRDGRFPRYKRWRLEITEQTTSASVVFALTLHPGEVTLSENCFSLPAGAGVQLGLAPLHALGVECCCECLLSDDTTRCITALGLRSMRHGSAELTFTSAVDLTYAVDAGVGTVYAEGDTPAETQVGFALSPWQPIGDDRWRTHNTRSMRFKREQEIARHLEKRV